MANPYYVKPAGGQLARGLSGIGQILEQKREEKKALAKEEEAKAAMQAAQTEIQDAIASGDPAKVAKVSIQYPQFRENIDSAMKISEDGQRDQQKAFMESVLSNPSQAREVTAQRAQMLQSEGRDATQSMQFLQELDQDYEGSMKNVENLYALQYPESYTAFRKANQETAGNTTAFQTLEQRALASGLKAGTPEFQSFMRHGGPAPSGTGEADKRDRTIADYQRLYGLSEEDATRQVDSRAMMDDKGNIITFDPTSGRGYMLDVNTGVEGPVIAPPAGVALEDLAFDPGEGTGFGASFLSLWNSTLGQLPFAPIAEDTAVAVQNLRILERDAIRALASSSRPPVIEQQRIMSIVPEGGDPFLNPQEAQFKMTNYVDLMMNQYVDDKRYMDNPRNPKKVREESGRRASEIESIIRRVLKPEAAAQMFESLNQIETDISVVSNMTTDQLADANPSTMTSAQRGLYIQRLREEMAK